MNPRHSLWPLLAVGSLAAVLPMARAQLIVSNLGETTVDGVLVANTEWYAQAFTTPSGSDYTLTTVELKLRQDTAGSPGTFTVGLWTAVTSDAGIQPGTQFASISSPIDVSSLPTSFSDEPFSPSTTVTLAANTQYFVVLAASAPLNTTGLLWGFTQSTASIGQLGGWTFGTDNAWNGLTTENPQQIAIFATAVPEPALWTLFSCSALLGFAAVRRSRQP